MSVWGRARGLLKDLEPGEGYVPQAFEELERQCLERAMRDPAIHLPVWKEHIRFEVIYGDGVESETECLLTIRYRERNQPPYRGSG